MRLSIGETIVSSIGPPPVVPTAIAFSPSAPNLQDNVVIGTVVSAVSVTTSNGSAFAGVLSLTGNDAGHFSLSGNNIVTATSISGLSTPRSVTVSATQNSVTKTGTLSVIVTPVVTGNAIIVQNANGTNPVTFANLTAAFAAVQPFQHVVITGSIVDAGTLSQNNVTVRGSVVTTLGKNGASLHDTNSQGKGIIYVTGQNCTIQDLELFNGRASDGSCAGIRWDGRNLNITRCYSHDNDMGILTGNVTNGSGYLFIDSCTLQNNGSANNSSTTHNMYIGDACQYLRVTNTLSLTPQVGGHCFKSRASVSTYSGCTAAITDGAGSRCFDISNGGVVNISNCVLEMGPGGNTDLIGMGLEGIYNPIAGVSSLSGTEGTTVSQVDTQQLTVRDCWVIADQGLVGGGLIHMNQNAAQVATVLGCKLVSTVDATLPLQFGHGQSSGVGTVVDGGSNTQFASRAAAGLGAFPALPAPFAADALAARLLDPNWTPGTWKQITNSREDDLGWLSLRRDAPNGVKAGINNMNPWSGGCIDTTNKGLLVFGGGHGDSNNNSVYRFNLTTLAWERLSEPSAPNELIFGEWTDHTPESVHTYGSPTFIPTLGLQGTMFHTGGAYSTSDNNGSGAPLTWLFDLATHAWTLGANNASTFGSGMQLQYDSNTNTVFIAGQGGPANIPTFKYNVSNGTYTNFNGNPLDDFHMTGAINPINHTFVSVACGVNDNGTAHLINDMLLSDGLRGRPPSTGDLTLLNSGIPSPGFDWDSTSQLFVAWGGTAGGSLATDLFLVTPPATVGGTYTWVKHTAGGGGDSPTVAQPDGTFGRFKYVPSHNCYVLVNDVNQNVLFYKKNF